jgi:2-polyprenyl-6-methoxyphenol hydroxylase-like FAD-dependent oxidoreductase
MSHNVKPTPHVLILGAGLGGLLLAQALTKQGISFEIYERDESLNARFQGYALAIQGS